MFEDAREGGELTDMEFVLDSGRRIRGHKVWLMARCEYIRVMLLSGMKEAKTGIVPVRECSDGGFMALLEYIYTGRVGMTCLGQDWGELWGVAHLFGMPGMGEMLVSGVTIDNVEEAAHVAVERGIVPLMEECVHELDFSKKNSVLKDSDARSMIRTMDLLVQNREATSWELTRGGIRAVLEAMKKLKDDASMLERACATLAAATDMVEDDASDVEANLGGIKCIVEALDNHRDHEGVQEHGWRAMENCGSETVMAAMNAHGRDNEWVRLHCCRALHRLANVRQPALQGEEPGGGEASSTHVTGITDMVRTVIESIRPKENGAEPLGKDVRVKQGLLALSNFGGGAVVFAMKEYSGDAWVQQHCCCTLAGLVKSSVGAENADEIRAVVWEKGGVEAVLGAMKCHRGSAAVLGEACSAIRLIIKGGATVSGGEERQRADKDRMFCALMDAAETHKGSSLVLPKALAALISFCDGGPANFFSPASAVEKKLSIVGVALEATKGVKARKAQAAACLVLAKLCGHFGCEAGGVEVRRFAVEAGGVEAVVKALVDHEDDVDVQANGCAAIGKLCADADARDRAGACGGVEAVVRAVVGTDDLRDDSVLRHNTKAWVTAGEALEMLCVGYERDDGNRFLALEAIGDRDVCEEFYEWVDTGLKEEWEDGSVSSGDPFDPRTVTVTSNVTVTSTTYDGNGNRSTTTVTPHRNGTSLTYYL